MPDSATAGPRPSPLGGAEAAEFVALHGDFFSESECRHEIDAAETRGFLGAESHYPPSYRNNARQVRDDPARAGALFARVRALAPPTLVDAHGARFVLSGLNPRLRFCRYGVGEVFHIHRDGPYVPNDTERSLLTFMVYLSDPSAFEGGETQFFDDGPRAHGPATRALKPARGTLILFDHALWHSGAEVRKGVKYILRSDLVYRRVAARMRTAAGTRTDKQGQAHDGYVWSLAALSDGRIASGGRDRVIRVWEGDRLSATLAGHTHSVLGVSTASDGALISISRDQTLRRWHTKTHAATHAQAIEGGTPIALVALPSALLAVGAADHRITLWSNTLAPLGVLSGHRGWVWGLCDGGAEQLWSASEDGSVSLWNLRTKQRIQQLFLGVPLRCLTRTADANTLAVGDAQGTIHFVRNTPSGLSRIAQHRCHDAAIRAITFAAGRIFSAGEDNCVRATSLDARSAPQRSRLLARHTDFATALLVWKRGLLLSAGYDGHIHTHAISASAPRTHARI